MTERAEQRRRRLSQIWRVLRNVLSLGIIAGIFLGVLPSIASYSDVWATIKDMTWLEVATLLLVGLWNLVTYWFVMVAVLPGLTFAQAAVVNQASTAVSNTMPAGGALGVGVTFAMYRSWGFSRSAIVLSTVVSGAWNTFAKLGIPVVALALLAVTGGANPALVTASILGVALLVTVLVVFALMLRSADLAHRLGEWAGRVVSRMRAWFKRSAVSGWGAGWQRFAADTSTLVKRRWLGITAAALISHLSLYVVLLVALRHVGISQEEVGWIQVLAAFAFVRLLSALPITPGGVGVVELGYTAALGVGLDDPSKAQVVAAVLVFRFITYVLPIPLGTGAYLFWRGNKSWRRKPADHEVGEEPSPEPQ